MTSQHQVSELDAINDSNSRPELRSSWDHVGTKSGPSRDQVLFKSPTQSDDPILRLLLVLKDGDKGDW
jgi:hypothetical protein